MFLLLSAGGVLFHVCQDRPDMPYASQIVMTVLDTLLAGHQRICGELHVICCVIHSSCPVALVYGDSVWAGEISKEMKRRSTTCVVEMIDKHAIDRASATEHTSGGLESVMQCWGFPLPASEEEQVSPWTSSSTT